MYTRYTYHFCYCFASVDELWAHSSDGTHTRQAPLRECNSGNVYSKHESSRIAVCQTLLGEAAASEPKFTEALLELYFSELVIEFSSWELFPEWDIRNRKWTLVLATKAVEPIHRCSQIITLKAREQSLEITAGISHSCTEGIVY